MYSLAKILFYHQIRLLDYKKAYNIFKKQKTFLKSIQNFKVGKSVIKNVLMYTIINFV